MPAYTPFYSQGTIGGQPYLPLLFIYLFIFGSILRFEFRASCLQVPYHLSHASSPTIWLLILIWF
jgi:hypothetical protein